MPQASYLQRRRQELIERENQRMQRRIGTVRPTYDFQQFEYQYATRKMHSSPPYVRSPPQLLSGSSHQCASPVPHGNAVEKAEASLREYGEFYGQIDSVLASYHECALYLDFSTANTPELHGNQANWSNSSLNNQMSSRFNQLQESVRYAKVNLPAEQPYQKESVFGFQNNNPGRAEPKRDKICQPAASLADQSNEAVDGLKRDSGARCVDFLTDETYKDSLNFAQPGDAAQHETDQLRTTDYDHADHTDQSSSAKTQNLLRNVDLGLGDGEDFD